MTKPELKIALIGSAPSSVRLAPFNDPSWQIWACSPGTYGVIPRCDLFFEPHRWEPGQPWFSPEYVQWLGSRKHPVMMAEVRPEVPTSQAIPADELVAKYGQYFFTSSLSWMFVMAMEMGATKIALYGVDMSATDEYAEQRSALHHFGLIAAARGVEVGTPPESDLFRPRPLYGVDEVRHSSIKLLARRRELESRMTDAQQRALNAQMEAQFLSGALDDLKYQTATWADRRDVLGPPVVESAKIFASAAPLTAYEKSIGVTVPINDLAAHSMVKNGIVTHQ